MAPVTALTLGTGLQVVEPDSSGPTAIEQALIEHRCSVTRATGALDTDPYQECLRAQLLSLRTDFGRDLSRLSGPERRTIDSVCSKIPPARDREAYVKCLSDQFASLRSRRIRATPAPSAGTTLPRPSVSAPPASPAPPARRASVWSSGLWMAATLMTVFVAAAGVLLVMKARRPGRKCRLCGQDVPDSGDLCQKCRREAADALRRAATERADHQRAQEQEQRRQSEHEEERRRQKAHDEEEARRRQQEQAHQEEKARHEGEVRQREEEVREEARQRSQSGVSSQEVFDPYAILGVPRDASHEDIRAAYEEARLKYDADQVAHLGDELQEHFRAKALAVERAYQTLTE